MAEDEQGDEASRQVLLMPYPCSVFKARDA